MTDNARLSQRDLRKKLLRLEAESHRLEVVANLRELRDPITHLQRVPALLGMFGAGAGAGGLGSLAAMFSATRLNWIIKAVPLALAGWRIAQRISAIFGKRRRRIRD